MTPVPASDGGEPAMEVSCEDLEKVLVGSDPERFFQLGSKLPPQEKSELVDFLRQNVDVFAWDTYEAPGVDLDFSCHHLNISPAITPKKQPPRRLERACRRRERGGQKIKESRGYQGGVLPQMVSQHSRGKKEEWEMVGLRRLHGPK